MQVNSGLVSASSRRDVGAPWGRTSAVVAKATHVTFSLRKIAQQKRNNWKIHQYNKNSESVESSSQNTPDVLGLFFEAHQLMLLGRD